jgi:hypothetical protein
MKSFSPEGVLSGIYLVLGITVRGVTLLLSAILGDIDKFKPIS